MLNGEHHGIAAGDRGAAPDVDHVRSERPHLRPAGQIDAAEDDAGIFGAGWTRTAERAPECSAIPE